MPCTALYVFKRKSQLLVLQRHWQDVRQDVLSDTLLPVVSPFFRGGEAFVHVHRDHMVEVQEG